MFWNKKKEVATIDNARNPELELCYTDKSGRKYFKWRNPLVIPTMRYLVGWSAIEYANMNIDARDAVEHLDKAIVANDNKKVSEVGYYLKSLRNRITSSDPEKAYLELASVYVVLQNESIKEYDQSLGAVKIALWKNDLDAKAFFLSLSWQMSAILTKSLKENTPTVLVTQMLQTMKLLSTILPKESEKDSAN